MGSRPNRLGILCFHELDDARHDTFGIVRLHEVEVALGAGRAEIGDRALVDAMGAGDDAALRGLPEHFGEAHYRHGAGCDDIRQDLAGADRRKLVDVANDQEGGPVGHRLHERLHQHDIDHGGFVDNQQVTVERVVVAALEAATLRVDLKQPVYGLGLEAGCLGHAFGGAAGRRTQEKAGALRREDSQNRFDDGGLSDAGPAGHDQYLGHQCEPDRGDLAFGQGETDVLLNPRQGLVWIDRWPRQRASCQSHQTLGDDAFRPMQTRQKYAGRFADPVGDYRALLQLETERSADKLLRDLEQLLGERYQLFRRQAAMTLIRGFGQRVGYSGAHTDHRRLLDAELHGDRVGSLEADAADIARQAIRILGHDLNGVGTIGLEDPHRPRRADTMAVQEHHDFPHRLLLGPGCENASSANPPDPIDLAQPIRRCLNDVEHLLAEGTHEFLGIDGSHAPDHAGREVFLDAVGRIGQRGAQKPRFELLTVGSIVDPFA